LRRFMARLENPLTNPCFGCGPRNRRGLRLSFERRRNEVWCIYTPRKDEIGWPGYMHPGLHYKVLRETSYWGALELGGKLHGASRKSIFEADSPPVGRPFRARSRIAKRTRRGLLMVTVSESLNGHRYGKFQSLYVPVKRSYVERSGLKLPRYLLEDIEP
jgi:hypothetical protein